MPEIFGKDGEEDSIAVSGGPNFDAPYEIRFVSNEWLPTLD